MDADGGNQQPVTDFSSAVIDWHPEGTGLIFNCDAFGEEQNVPDICTMDADGNVEQIIDRDATREFDAHYAPDGGTVWFTVDVGGDLDVYSLDVASGEITPRLHTEEFEEQARPSPDGTRLLFTLTWHADLDNVDIYVWDLGEDTFLGLTDAPGKDSMPEWSPDGSEILFASDRTGSWDLWIMDSDGSNLRQLTETPDIDEIVPSW